MAVSVIIPNYNGLDLLRENLPLVVKAGDNPGNMIEEIIVIDDGSTDGSSEYLKKEFPRIKLIKHTKNRGFSSAVNTGVRAAKGDLVVLLNTDVVPSENFMRKVIPYFESGDVFAVSLHEKNYGWAKGIFKAGFIQHEPGSDDGRSHQTFWVSGGSGVFRRDLWFELGGMDEELFNPYYWEDVDLGYRALKKGYKLYWEPDAHVVHKHETTIGTVSRRKRSTIQERNQLLFIWKNLTSPRMFQLHLTGLLSRTVKHPGYLRVVLLALFKVPYIIKARRKSIKLQKVSDETIFNSFN